MARSRSPTSARHRRGPLRARWRGAGVLAVAGGGAGRIRRPPDAGWGALARGSMVSTSERLTRNVVISMTANQPTPRPRALQAVRRAARSLNPLHYHQVMMWEAWRRSGWLPVT